MNKEAEDSKNSPAPAQALDEKKCELTVYFFFCLLACCLGTSFQFGWNIGMFNTPVKIFRNFFNETEFHRESKYMSELKWNTLWGLTNGLLPLGIMVGGFMSGHLANMVGRKYSILAVNVIVFLAGGLAISSKSLKSYVPFIIGRLISGIYCGVFLGCGIIYCSEISPRNYRGFSVSVFQLLITVGQFWSSIFGIRQIFGNSALWPFIIAATFVPSVIQLILFPFCVESPKYMYINRNDTKKAEKILREIRVKNNEELIKNEIEELESEKQLSVAMNAFSYRNLVMKPSLLRPLALIIVIEIAFNFTGINVMFFYSTKLFISAGFDPNGLAVYSTIVLNFFMIAATLVNTLLVEITGRRMLLIYGFIGMSITSFLMVLLPLIGQNHQWYKYSMVVVAILFSISFSIGPGPIAMILVGELFPSESRGHAASIAVLVNSFCSFIVAIVLPLLMQLIENYIFLIFGLFTWVFIIYIYMKLPETKQKTIEEINKNFQD